MSVPAGSTMADPGTEALGALIQRVDQRRNTSWRIKFLSMWLAIVIGLVAFVALTVKLDADFLNGWAPFILAGVPVTLFIAAVSITLAIVLAAIGALGRLSGNPFFNGIASFYVSFFRGTPLLLQILFLFLALPQAGIVLDPLPTAIIALGFNYGAYMTEIFRAGIERRPSATTSSRCSRIRRSPTWSGCRSSCGGPRRPGGPPSSRCRRCSSRRSSTGS
jgi:polar amino acid transport system permease protein